MSDVTPPVELVGNALCLDFANTVNVRPHPDRDLLTSHQGLATWAAAAGLVEGTAPAATAADLGALRELREAVHDVFAAVAAGRPPPAAPLATVVDAYADALPHARWQRTGQQLAPALPPPASAAELARHIAVSAIDLLRGGPLDRVGRCPGCGWLFVDTSRNGRRRWCSMATCGSRTKAARFYARTRSGPTPTTTAAGPDGSSPPGDRLTGPR